MANPFSPYPLHSAESLASSYSFNSIPGRHPPIPRSYLIIIRLISGWNTQARTALIPRLPRRSPAIALVMQEFVSDRRKYLSTWPFLSKTLD